MEAMFRIGQTGIGKPIKPKDPKPANLSGTEIMRKLKRDSVDKHLKGKESAPSVPSKP